MLKNLSIILSSFLIFPVVCLLSSSYCEAAPAIAPEFTLQDIHGKTHKLSDYKGKLVVLEWFCSSCPFVKKHYEHGHMQKLQEKYTGLGVVWLTVNSSGPGRQGFLTSEEAQAKVKEWNIKASAELVDSEGTVGKAYGAKTTPHMFVVNKDGSVAYQGAIDSDDSTKEESLETAKNYVSMALDELLAGKSVSIAETESYGCGVKYKQ